MGTGSMKGSGAADDVAGAVVGGAVASATEIKVKERATSENRFNIKPSEEYA
jgi:hypothetical protein